MHFYSMQRDPANFTLPNSFFPERWIIAEGGKYPSYTTKLPSASSTLPSEKLVHNPNAFVPFSFGPANCVGKNLALQEMKMVVCNFMQNLEMRLADWWDANEWERKMEAPFVVLVPPLPVVVKKRE